MTLGLSVATWVMLGYATLVVTAVIAAHWADPW